ncbi:MAG: ribonuclease III [Firmicutes bacterium]|nr:ribonuclease III [Bacillota bacterium]
MEEGIEQKRVDSGLLQRIGEFFPGKRQDPKAYSPLALAYIGDAFYDLIIRTVVVERANRPVRDLHRITAGYVNAGFQAKMAAALMDGLTEEESAVYRRGRNAKPHTKAKNASMEDYLKATGFEAVLGYLYLTDDTERALELVRAGLDAVGGIR